MEHSPERQPATTGAATVTPYLAVPTAPSVAVMPRPSSWVVFRRGFRLLLRRLLYGLARIGRVLKPYAAFVVVVALLLGVISWMAFQLWMPATTSDGPIADTRVSMLAPVSSVENYIKGQQNFNAELMWASLSPDSQAEQMRGGLSKQTMQSRVDYKKGLGLRFSKYDYVGGVPMDGGGKMYFYSVKVERGDQNATFPMTFVVDDEGKVTNIISPLSDLVEPDNS